jgi:plasmid stabilization system protein ParE
MNNREYLEKEAKAWIEDFFGEERDPNSEIEEMWGWVEDEENPPLSEDEFYRLAFKVKAALINGTDIPDMPNEIHDRIYETMHHYDFRRIQPSLLEKYKEELEDEETAEQYDALISNISAEYLKLVERLGTGTTRLEIESSCENCGRTDYPRTRDGYCSFCDPWNYPEEIEETEE